jgi:energy-dependent translational throttle protein EttA
VSTPQYIYVMKDLRKVVPPSREILKGIWLSFFPGAKIGVVGANGAGKSSLLRIMAGIDTEFQGEAWAARVRASDTCLRNRSSTPPSM